MTTATVTADRRIAPRRQPAIGTVLRFDPAIDLGPGLVWNLSATGVSMLVTDPPVVGAVLAGQLETEAGDELPVLFRVVHVKELQSGDFYVGGHFARPLAAAEMKPFVA
jgi:hypothetical protein